MIRCVQKQPVEKICDYYMQMFSSIDDEMFQQATDVCDIKTRLLKILLDVEDVDLANVPEGTVLSSRRLNSIYDCRNQP